MIILKCDLCGEHQNSMVDLVRRAAFPARTVLAIFFSFKELNEVCKGCVNAFEDTVKKEMNVLENSALEKVRAAIGEILSASKQS